MFHEQGKSISGPRSTVYNPESIWLIGPNPVKSAQGWHRSETCVGMVDLARSSGRSYNKKKSQSNVWARGFMEAGENCGTHQEIDIKTATHMPCDVAVERPNSRIVGVELEDHVPVRA